MVKQTPPTRQDLLRGWLTAHRLTNRWLAHRMGVTDQRMSQVLAAETCPQSYIELLVGLGVPEELLPKPSRGRPGPVPSVRDESAAQNAGR